MRQECPSGLQTVTLQVSDRVSGYFKKLYHRDARASRIQSVVGQCALQLGIQEYSSELPKIFGEIFQRIEILARFPRPSVFQGPERPFPFRQASRTHARSEHSIGETFAECPEQGVVDPIDRRAQIRISETP